MHIAAVDRWFKAMCPPVWAHWRHLANTIELMPTTQTANRSVQQFLHSSQQKVRILYNGHPYPPELALPMGDLDSHLTHDGLGPCEPRTQTAPRLLKPYLHRWPQSTRQYILQWFACQNCLFPWRDLNSMWGPDTWFIGPTWVLNFNSNSITSAVFADLTSVIDWQSDTQTNRPRYSAGNNSVIGHMYVHRTAMWHNST